MSITEQGFEKQSEKDDLLFDCLSFGSSLGGGSWHLNFDLLECVKHEEMVCRELSAVDLNEILKETIRRLTSGHQRIGIMLSGGIDSANILAHLAELENKEIIAYSWGGWGEGSTDVVFSRLSAKRYGINEHRVVCKQIDEEEQELEIFRDELHKLNEPLNYFETVAYCRMRELMLKDGVTCVFQGQNADTLWMAYPAPVLIHRATKVVGFLPYFKKLFSPMRLMGRLKSFGLSPYIKYPNKYWDRIDGFNESVMSLNCNLQQKLIIMEELFTEARARQAHSLRLFQSAGITPLNPYYEKEVVMAALRITNEERGRGGFQKALLYDVARKNGVPQEVIEKGKKGLSYGYKDMMRKGKHLKIWDDVQRGGRLSSYLDLAKAKTKLSESFFAMDRIRSLDEYLKIRL